MKLFALPIRIGIATAGCLIVYFLILSLLDFHTNIFFSLFNSVITAVGIYIGIKIFRDRNRSGFNYGKGFVAGIVTGGVATSIFTLFFAIYCTELNPNFLEYLSAAWFKKYQSFQTLIFFLCRRNGFNHNFSSDAIFYATFQDFEQSGQKNNLISFQIPCRLPIYAYICIRLKKI